MRNLQIHGPIEPLQSLFHFAPQSNWSVNADATKSHRFVILIAHAGALRASRSGAGYLWRWVSQEERSESS